MTTEHWRDDLHALVGGLLTRHCDLFHHTDRNTFRRRVLTLDERIPALADHEIVVEFARLVAAVGDGHTTLSLSDVAGFHRYPLSLYRYTDGLFVRSIDRGHADAAGARLVQIDDTSAEDVYATVRELVSRDNEMGVMKVVPDLLVIPEVLHACGITSSTEAAHFTFQRDDEQHVNAGFRAMDQVTTDLADARERSDAPTPLWLMRSTPNWFTYLRDEGTLYVQHGLVRDGPDESLAAFWDGVFAAVDAERVERFVLDLRHNGGGNMTLNQALIHHLIRRDRVNQWGRLFAVIGRGTFSAAMNLATDLERHTRVLFVGEPTGSSPNHFGENGPFSLLCSGLHLTASMCWYQHSDPRDRRPWIEPDIPAGLSSSDYAAQRDPALDAIRAYSARPEHMVEYPARLTRVLDSISQTRATYSEVEA